MRSSPISVLIVENHPLMREALHTAIDEEPGLTVAGEATRVTEVLLMAPALDVDVILISIAAPGPETVGAMDALRQALPAARILALMSDQVSGQEKDALNAVSHAVLTKAVSRAELMHAIHEMAASIRTAAD